MPRFRFVLQCLFIFLSILMLLASCAMDAIPPASRIDPAPQITSGALAVEQARIRKNQLERIRYRFHLVIGAGDEFDGDADIRFDLKKTGEPVLVDFSGGSIEVLQVNGLFTDALYDGQYIRLPDRLLKQGYNVVRVKYHLPYDYGLLKFVDPEDGLTYVYANFEPYSANKVFPLFDQPDLKASYRLAVTAPAGWQVISCMRESNIQQIDGLKVWTFPESPDLVPCIKFRHSN